MDKAHSPEVELVERFYAALRRRDGAAMAACYHRQVHFKDPIFELDGRAAGEMWRMLCSRGGDMRVSVNYVRTEGAQVHAQWEARYTFSGTRRKVHNVINSRFDFKEGLIIQQLDQFSFWRWSRQALGLTGWLLGWSHLLHGKVRRKAMRSLSTFCDAPQRENPRQNF